MEWILGLVFCVILLCFLWTRRKKPSVRTTTFREQSAHRAPAIAALPAQVRLAKDPSSRRRSDARWVPQGQPVTVAGTVIQSGLIYLGSQLTSQVSGSNENCLINPSLAVDPPPGDPAGASMPYWPSYERISPAARRAYLDWLASKRADSNTYVGFVFLYFYGLERRLLIDQCSSETPVIVAEIGRLLSLYDTNGSFRHYATALLDAVDLKAGVGNLKPDLSSYERCRELPFGLRVAIGQILAKGEALSADWALAWYLSHPETRLRTAAKRCFSEFVDLFRKFFADRFPNGMKVTSPRRRLPALSYRAASATFSVNIEGEFQKWPDIVSLTAPLKEIEPIAEKCTSDLEPYSRAIRRSTEAHRPIEAAMLLPSELIGSSAAAPLNQIRDWLDSLIAGAVGLVPIQNLQEKLGLTSSDAKLTKRFVFNLSTVLASIGFGMEPDPRFGGSTPEAGSEVLLFRAPGGALLDKPSPEYLLARLHVEIGVLIANVDRKISSGDLE